MNMHCEKLGRRLKLIVPKYRPDPVSRLEDIPEKVYSTELKPIVAVGRSRVQASGSASDCTRRPIGASWITPGQGLYRRAACAHMCAARACVCEARVRVLCVCVRVGYV